MRTLRVTLALALSLLTIPWFTAPVLAALVTLPAPFLWPDPPPGDLGDAETVTETNCTLTVGTDYCAFVWMNPTTFTADAAEAMIGAITAWPATGLKVSYQTVSAAAAPNGLLGGSSSVNYNPNAGAGPASNTWANFGTGMAAAFTPGVYYAMKIELQNTAETPNLAIVVVSGTASVGPRQTLLVTKNGTRQSSTWPRMGIVDLSGNYLYVHGAYTHFGDLTNNVVDFIGRPDPFYASTTTITTGPNVITQVTGTALTSTLNGITTARTPNRVRLFDGTQAGAMRLAIQMTTPADGTGAATLAEGFPANIAAASSVAWEKITFMQHGCLTFQTPATMRTIGAWVAMWNSSSSSLFTWKLYDTNTWTLLSSVSNAVTATNTIGLIGYYYFTSPYLLRSRHAYSLCLVADTTGAATIGIPVAATTTTARFKAFMNSSTWQYAERFKLVGANTIKSMTSGVIILNTGALTLTNRVIYNSTNPTYSDWVEFTSGANSGIWCQITALTDQGSPTGFTVGNCTAAIVDIANLSTVTWNRWNSLYPAYTTLWPSLGLIVDQIAVGDDTSWLTRLYDSLGVAPVSDEPWLRRLLDGLDVPETADAVMQ